MSERAVMHRVHSWLLSMVCVLCYSCVCGRVMCVCGRVMCVLQLCVCVVVWCVYYSCAWSSSSVMACLMSVLAPSFNRCTLTTSVTINSCICLFVVVLCCAQLLPGWPVWFAWKTGERPGIWSVLVKMSGTCRVRCKAARAVCYVSLFTTLSTSQRVKLKCVASVVASRLALLCHTQAAERRIQRILYKL